MADWRIEENFPVKLDAVAIAALSGLKPAAISLGTVLFRPGDRPRVFVILLSGRIGVYLVGRGGRELELYSVSRNETCVQTTLGMMGEQVYSAEAIAETDLTALLVPSDTFQNLMAQSPAFRTFVFQAFAARVGDVMRVLEQVAFVRVESRLAAMLIDRMDGAGLVAATQQELAIAIGTAREVVSRQLKSLAIRKLIVVERNRVRVVDRNGLGKLVTQE